MSIFRYLFDSDWFQRADIIRLEEENEGLSTQLGQTRDQARTIEERSVALEEEVAQLTLFNKTLLRMLVEKRVCTPEEFTNLMGMVDLEDGVRDGKATAPATPDERPLCSNCKRPLPKNKPRCMYCGR